MPSQLRKRRQIRTAPVERQDLKIICDGHIEKWLAESWLTEREANSTRESIQLAIENALLEIRIAVGESMKKGFFRVSTDRIKKMWSDRAYDLLRRFLDRCPYVKKLKGHCPGKFARTFTINSPKAKPRKVPGNTTGENLETVNEYASYGAHAWISSLPRSVLVPASVLADRDVRWANVCGRMGWVCCLDIFDFSGVFESISSLEIDNVIEVEKKLLTPEKTPKKEKKRLAKLRNFRREKRRLQHGITRLQVKKFRNRIYHPISSVPKSIRKHLSWDGEQIAEVDLGSSYWCALTSRLRDSAEKRRLIRLLQSGKFYRFLARVAGIEYSNKIKKRVQIECLFWPDRMRSRNIRPLWRALEKVSPQLCKLISSVRGKCGPGGLSDYLCWIESQVMFPAFKLILRQCGRCLPLHDAALVPSYLQDRAKQIIEQIGEQVFGFVPRVSTK